MKKLTMITLLMTMVLMVSCGDDKKSKSHQGVSYDQLNPSTVSGFVLQNGQLHINGENFQLVNGQQALNSFFGQQVPLFMSQGRQPTPINGAMGFPASITGYVVNQCQQMAQYNPQGYQQCMTQLQQPGIVKQFFASQLIIQ